MIDFGTYLKSEREKRGWSGERLAEEIGTSQGNVSMYERGERVPRRGMVEKIAQSLGINSEPALIAAGFIPKNARRVVLPTGDVIEINPDDDEPQKTIDATAAFLAGWRARQTVKQ